MNVWLTLGVGRYVLHLNASASHNSDDDEADDDAEAEPDDLTAEHELAEVDDTHTGRVGFQRVPRPRPPTA